MRPVLPQCWLAAVVLTAAPSAAEAQSAPAAPASAPAPAPSVLGALEITPHVSFTDDEASGIGASVGLRLRPRLVVELDAEARLTNPERFQRVQANVVWDLRGSGRVTPFLLAGAGYDAYRGAYVLPEAGVFGWTSSGLGVSAGGGVRVPIGGRWALRTDVRFSGGVSQGLPNRVRVFQGVTRRLAPR
jgi:hypothetical protein